MMSAHTDVAAALTGSLIIAVAVCVLFVTLCRAALRVGRRFRYRSIFTSAILQSPGYRLRRELDVQRDQVRVLGAALVTLPLVFLAVLLAWPGELQASPTELRGLLMLIVAVAALAWLCTALVRRVVMGARTRYALSADIAVSQALERVMKKDFSVFHDVHADTRVVDKVVVGHKGVFALTILMHARRRGDQKSESVAQFDGRYLRFPDGTSHDPVACAQPQARALARDLSRQTGKPIAVCPVLVVPGWPLTCAAQPDFPVVNERNIDLIVQWSRPESWLLDEEVESLQAHLTERCRDRRYLT